MNDKGIEERLRQMEENGDWNIAERLRQKNEHSDFIERVRDEQGEVSTERNSHDYAQELFDLSRATPNILEPVAVMIERAWAGDVAAYIAQLENEIKALQEAGDE